jgi:hypothetical protein
LCGCDAHGNPLVSCAGGAPQAVLANPDIPRARLARAVRDQAQVVLVDGLGDLPPVIAFTVPAGLSAAGTPEEVPATVVTGTAVEVVAAERLRLVCGQAAIELTADGAVTVSGLDITASARGLHRIQGNAVRIN